MMRTYAITLPFLTLFGAPDNVLAQSKATLAREAAEFVIGKFGKEAAKEGVEGLARKIEVLVLKHGDEALLAVKRVGPRTFRLVEEAGEHGLETVRLLARHGDDAIWVVAKKDRMAIFMKYGDKAAEAMMKHGEIAEPIVRSGGTAAARALVVISTQNGRRLAMMEDQGDLSKIGQTSKLHDVIAKYGDRAMEFVWTHKRSLTDADALIAFLTDPEPFLDEVADISKVASDIEKVPSTSVSTHSEVDEAARRRVLILVIGLVALGIIGGVCLILRNNASSRSAKVDRTA